MPAILDGPSASRLSPRSPVVPQSAPILERRTRRSHSISDFPPPPMRRFSAEVAGSMRPVSFSAKFTRVHPATTGVTVLEHMERLDAVEASLKRIGVEESAVDEDAEEDDVGMVRAKPAKKRAQPGAVQQSPEEPPAGPPLSPSALSPERLPMLMEDDAATEDNRSVDEEDLVAMSKSMPHLEQSPPLAHTRWTSQLERPSLDWMDVDSTSSAKRRLAIAEVSSAILYTQRSFRLILRTTATGNRRHQTFLLVLVIWTSSAWTLLCFTCSGCTIIFGSYDARQDRYMRIMLQHSKPGTAPSRLLPSATVRSHPTAFSRRCRRRLHRRRCACIAVSRRRGKL